MALRSARARAKFLFRPSTSAKPKKYVYVRSSRREKEITWKVLVKRRAGERAGGGDACLPGCHRGSRLLPCAAGGAGPAIARKEVTLDLRNCHDWLSGYHARGVLDDFHVPCVNIAIDPREPDDHIHLVAGVQLRAFATPDPPRRVGGGLGAVGLRRAVALVLVCVCVCAV